MRPQIGALGGIASPGRRLPGAVHLTVRDAKTVEPSVHGAGTPGPEVGRAASSRFEVDKLPMRSGREQPELQAEGKV